MAEYNEKMIDNAIGVLRGNDACVLSALAAATVVGMLEDYKRIKTDCIRLEREVLEANSRADARWIPCSEALPDVDRNVLLCDRQIGEVYEGCRMQDGQWTDYDFSIDPENVTHWMPLPELPPKGAE